VLITKCVLIIVIQSIGCVYPVYALMFSVEKLLVINTTTERACFPESKGEDLPIIYISQCPIETNFCRQRCHKNLCPDHGINRIYTTKCFFLFPHSSTAVMSLGLLKQRLP
jgi:hypothetical protein